MELSLIADAFSAASSLTGPPAELVLGGAPAMQPVRQKVLKVSRASVPLLIHGENGTGKEVLARLIHRMSASTRGPFVKLNCAAIPGTLLESELLGYQKGAFTGATAAKAGLVELAQSGTLFLDEIADLNSSLQAKLLQLLQDGRFCRLGDAGETQMEARVICATNRDLAHDVAAGTFRPDLFYRINVIHIHMPPLRERRADIPALAAYFLESCNARYGRTAPRFSREQLQLLQTRDWPGNIRELENAVARHVILGSEDALCDPLVERRSSLLPFEPAADGSIPLKRITKQAVRTMERDLILRVLQANQWNRRKTAAVLKISYRGLLYKIREAGLPSKHHNRFSAAEDIAFTAT